MSLVDGVVLHVEKGDADEAHDLEIAQAIGDALTRRYPHHYWLISFAGHNLIVRHVAIANAVAFATGREGFGSLLPRNKIGTVQEATREALKHAGALLEAFGLPRGPWKGEEPVVPQDLKDAVMQGQAHRIAQIMQGLARG